jgi:hypothetical protein
VKKKNYRFNLGISAEFKDKNSAGQNNQNPNEFTLPYYNVYWVTRGYVVLDDASSYYW